MTSISGSAGYNAFLQTVAGCLRPGGLFSMQVLGDLPCLVSGLLMMSAMRSGQ